MFKSLNANSSYSTSQFADILSQKFFALYENNINNKNNYYKKLIQKSLKFDKLHKSFSISLIKN